MADFRDRLPLNKLGKFYVDSTCIDCDACRATAPDNFQRDDETCSTYVFKQPENDIERQLCQEAADGCPTASIGDDGDEHESLEQFKGL